MEAALDQPTNQCNEADLSYETSQSDETNHSNDFDQNFENGIDHSIDHSLDQSIDDINQTTDQSIDHDINQTTEQNVEYSLESAITHSNEQAIDQGAKLDNRSSTLKSIGDPPKLISSPSSTLAKPPRLISSHPMNKPIIYLSNHPTTEEHRLQNGLPAATVCDPIAFNEEEVVSSQNLIDCALIAENGKSTESGPATDKQMNGDQLDNPMASNRNDCLLDTKPGQIGGGGQWPNSDSAFLLDKYFLRGADDASESLLQECVQSNFGDHQSDCNLINSQPVDSLFKFDEDATDHKPSPTELNYYSSQYQANPNCFGQTLERPPQYPHLSQANIYSHFLHSFNSLGHYSPHSHVHPTMLNGDAGHLPNEQLSNGNSTTVTYSNGTGSLLPTISHHHAFKSNSVETSCGSGSQLQPPSQHYYPSSHQSSLHSNFSGSFNDLSSCDNSFGFSSIGASSYGRSGLAPHPMSAVFDIDAGCIQDEQAKDAEALKAKLVKEERLDEFGSIRNSLDLVNSNEDFMAGYPTANEHLVMNSQAPPPPHHHHHHHPTLVHSISIQRPPQLNQHQLPAAAQHPAGGDSSGFYSVNPKPQPPTKTNSMSIKMSASSIVNGSRKLITLKEAANVKLEKVKIERANGMKIYYFKCSLCTYQTNTSQSMKDHLYCIHCKAKNNYKCNICQQTFGWKNNAQRHMRRKHKIEDQTTKREAIITLV